MSFKSVLKTDEKWIADTWLKLDKKLSLTAVKSRYKTPYTTVNGTHDDRFKEDALAWTNGFWGGLMMLMYMATGKDCYLQTAKVQEKRLDAAFNEMDRWHHDVGFMWHILSGVNYRLTGDRDSKNRNLIAAMSLMSRYNVAGDFIRCWNGNGEEDVSGWTIIDCMMNIPILYWASDLIGDDRFKKIAMRHADMTMKYHVRADGSVNHIVMHDTGKPGAILGVKAGQGYSASSSWSRGTAWAIYGFVISYIHTKKAEYLETAEKSAKFFIEKIKESGYLTKIDLCQPAKPEYYDSTAGVIAASGLIEIAKLCAGDKADYYLNAAINILKITEKKWCDFTDKEDSVVQSGSEAYSFGINKPIIYGDYFFTEAMLKLKGNGFLVW